MDLCVFGSRSDFLTEAFSGRSASPLRLMPNSCESRAHEAHTRSADLMILCAASVNLGSSSVTRQGILAMRACKMLTKYEGIAIPEVLWLGAHADDIEIGCGGAVLNICSEFSGALVHWIMLGVHGPRAAEARTGAQRLKARSAGGELTVIDIRNGFFSAEWPSTKELFESLKERVFPDLIFTHQRFDRHQDLQGRVGPHLEHLAGPPNLGVRGAQVGRRPPCSVASDTQGRRWTGNQAD